MIWEQKIKFRDYNHYVIYAMCLEMGRIQLGVDRDFKIRNRKNKKQPGKTANKRK